MIVDLLLQGGQTPAYVFTPEATADSGPPRIPYADMDQAERGTESRRLIEEAGEDDLSFRLL